MNLTTRRFLAHAAVGLAIGVMLCSAVHAQTKPTCLLKSDAKLMPTWWPKTTEQPTGGYIEVARAGVAVRQIPLVLVAPTSAEIKAGTAPDARRICFPMSSLRDGDVLIPVTTLGEAWTRSTPCQFWTGDPYTFRDYAATGAPVERIATIKARVVPVGANSGTCTTTRAATSEAPPPVVVTPDPPVTPPTTPPASGTWVALVPEWFSFDRGAATIRFGVPGNWREVQVNGYAMCAAKTLGLGDFDPAPNTTKACQILQ
jgi:hypothetical protein